MSNWYENSRRTIQAAYGKDWRLFCGLLAATSPNASIKANTTLARKAYNQFKATGTITKQGWLPLHYWLLTQFLTSGTLSGRKANSFYRNLIGDESVVTVDRWIARHMKLTSKAPTAKQYDHIENLFRWNAVFAGLSPAQYQAKIWEQERGDSGSYSASLAQLRLF